jgi:hypothetical protein
MKTVTVDVGGLVSSPSADGVRRRLAVPRVAMPGLVARWPADRPARVAAR